MVSRLLPHRVERPPSGGGAGIVVQEVATVKYRRTISTPPAMARVGHRGQFGVLMEGASRPSPTRTTQAGKTYGLDLSMVGTSSWFLTSWISHGRPIAHPSHTLPTLPTQGKLGHGSTRSRMATPAYWTYRVAPLSPTGSTAQQSRIGSHCVARRAGSRPCFGAAQLRQGPDTWLEDHTPLESPNHSSALSARLCFISALSAKLCFTCSD